MVLPLVCKPWEHILARPCAAWATINIDTKVLHNRRAHDYEPGRPFLDARAIAVRWSR